MDIFKKENKIVVTLCCVFLVGRSIYLEYLSGSRIIGFTAFCGFFVILYIVMAWIGNKKR